MRRLALIVGVTGGLASEAAKALLDRGSTVRGLTREPERAKPRFPALASIDWRAGDAMRAHDVLHSANPPRYRIGAALRFRCWRIPSPLPKRWARA